MLQQQQQNAIYLAGSKSRDSATDKVKAVLLNAFATDKVNNKNDHVIGGTE